MNLAAAGFLRGASGRLLPASIPLRFFVLAGLSQLGLWVGLLVCAAQVPQFSGGLSQVLSAVHALTLGVLSSTVIGAALQILPVATCRPLLAIWPVRLLFWLLLAGLLLFVSALFTIRPPLISLGAALVASALLLFALLLADNLRRAASTPMIARYGWAALAALIGVAALGVALARDFQTAQLPRHGAASLAHLILGGYGFMGLLALGFSHVLVPMFTLSAAPAARPALLGFLSAASAVLLGTIGALCNWSLLLWLALGLGLAASAIHLYLMRQVLRSGMRKRLGLSFVLVKAAWMALPLSLLCGALCLLGWAGPRGPLLFGVLLFGAWLLTFLFGVLQRILPMLVSLHATPGSASLASRSEQFGALALKAHALGHALAIITLLGAIALDSVGAVRVASAFGCAGAVGFLGFVGAASWRLLPQRS